MNIPSSTLVEVQNIQMDFHYHTALKDVSLAVKRGEIVTLIGPNGAGKSTLVKVILGLLTPQKGQVFRQAGIKIGYMPQRLSVDMALPLTVERFLRLSGITQLATIQAVLAEVGASAVLQRPLQHVSGGELQRVLLARALLRYPDLLVLDEPIQGVDVGGQYELYDLISRIRTQRGCGVLMVSHDLHIVMAATDHVVCLNQHICCSGHPGIVSRHPAYLSLFGARPARDLAFYTHHHHCAEHTVNEENIPITEESVLPANEQSIHPLHSAVVITKD
ncbi:zinc ABC transporter ATP-binding protein ZnuC [Beggiatoa leptomitoformis]|uniref:Zinc ABC transporter ATP-binding protein ZnuC n=1 Tax=Beggiatoa leptomitoformis TaxID=288004 RepID=A0A2N9YB06_9GAMM|nr:zinc ABC transporter ATP-binding protein ZnuC [Beggiatoa leptomitoformis]ALG66972.1 zinc ABC transporter ATP-binding protein ZnuC [Beggiatoa leptomitoformis]AUI67657.1 zinc ABC transporter ATP-binding protein ZnuC [Beggiatoa leptomitoformis]